MKSILLLGDYKNPQWHPLRGVDSALERILEGFEMTITEDYPYLRLGDMQKYDLIINYIDAADKRAGTDFAGALLGYVAAGGTLLTLHNGIIARNLPEIGQMIGAAFTGHPPHEVIEYTAAAAHPIMNSIEPFAIDEEPYQFEMDNLAAVNIMMEYTYKGEKYPAAWLRGFGSGKSVYLSMGHSAASFESEGFAKLIRRSALWCAGETL